MATEREIAAWWYQNRMRKAGGLTLPTFADPVGGALQHLFNTSKSLPAVGSDGYTYVQDAANTGTDRDPRAGAAKAYDGVNGITTIAHSADLTFGNGTVDQACSFRAIINMTDASQFKILTKSSATQAEYQFHLDGSDRLSIRMHDLDNVNYIQALTTALTAYEGQYIFVAGTYDGSGLNTGLEVYAYDLTGTIIATTDTQSTAGVYVAMEGNSLNQYIGLYETSSAYASGDIASVIVDNVELPQTEIEKWVDNPTYLTGHEVGIWHLDEEVVGTSFDSSGNGNHGTDTGGVTTTTQSTVTFPNVYGFNISGSTVIPARLDTIPPTVDAQGTTLTYSGRAPKNGKLVNSNCVTMDGVGDKITAAHLTGSETVTSSGGTSTPTVGVGEITFTAGTCWDLVLSDGTEYPLAEGAGLTAYDISGNGNNGTIVGTEAAIWAATQDVYHYNILNGFELSGSTRIPAGASSNVTNPSGKWHNGAETEWQPNPFSDPELEYRAGLDSTVERASTDTFARPEFIDKNDATQVKNYAVYDKNISTADGDTVDALLGN